MAIIINITQPGNNLTGSLNGRIVIDEGRGRFVVTDTLGNPRTVTDVDGLKIYNPALGEIIRGGIMPDGTYGIVVAKDGDTIQDVF